MEYVIEPVVKPLGYDVERSDTLPNPGMITGQVIDKLLTCELVLADLSFHNPNVFYELAIRHMTDLPVIQMISPFGKNIPFDIRDMRTVYFGTDLPSCDAGKKELQKQVSEIIGAPGKIIDNPIRQALNGRKFKEWAEKQMSAGTSGNLDKAFMARMVSLMDDVKNIKETLSNNPVGAIAPNQEIDRAQSAPKKMKVVQTNTYHRPGLKINELDLSGMIETVQLMISSDGSYKSWQVHLTGIESEASRMLFDLIKATKSAVDLEVEQRDPASNDSSFSGLTIISNVRSSLDTAQSKAILTGTGPLKFKTG
ncbi:MAG: hypothetical protein SA339_13825 [Methanomassiliicoccus sp.]|nr:hypothetical protein [Methanomassiliicoccus sp.]